MSAEGTPRNVAAQEVRLFLPSRAVTDLKGQFANQRDVESDVLGNKSENTVLAEGAIRALARELTDGDGFEIRPDGEIVEAGE